MEADISTLRKTGRFYFALTSSGIKRNSHLSASHNSHQLLRFLKHCRMNGLGNRAALRVPGAFTWTINAVISMGRRNTTLEPT